MFRPPAEAWRDWIKRVAPPLTALFAALAAFLVLYARLKPPSGLIYASPVLAEGRIYYVSQRTGTYVVAARPKFELLAHNVFADDNSRANASPAVSDGQLLFRTDRHLYCIGTR